MIMKKVNVVFVMTLRPCSHNAKFGLFCKTICQQEAISSANDFSNLQNFSTATKLQRCRWEHILEAYNFLPGNKILWFLTAILRRVILFREHDQRGKSCKNKKLMITKFPNFLQAWVWTGPKSEFTHLSMLCPLPYYTSPAPLWLVH